MSQAPCWVLEGMQTQDFGLWSGALHKGDNTCALVTLTPSKACYRAGGKVYGSRGRSPEAGGGVSQETLKPAGVKAFRAPFWQLLCSDHPWFLDPGFVPHDPASSDLSGAGLSVDSHVLHDQRSFTLPPSGVPGRESRPGTTSPGGPNLHLPCAAMSAGTPARPLCPPPKGLPMQEGCSGAWGSSSSPA